MVRMGFRLEGEGVQGGRLSRGGADQLAVAEW